MTLFWRGTKFFPFSRPNNAASFARCEERFSPGQILFQKGDEGDYCVLVLSGRARISISSKEGKEVLIDLAGPGDLLGEMALLDGQTRSADVRAEGPCVCARISRAAFMTFIQENSGAAFALFRLLCGRLRRTNEQMERIALHGLPARLARYLLGLAEKEGGPRLRSGLKQSDIAEHLAASRESINKLLNIWQNHGLISLLLQRDIVLNDKDGLREIAGI